MKILHYALGFPPYRSGGLTKFCVDLMVQQAKEGHIVAMLWPGQMRFVNHEVSIKKHRIEHLKEQDIQSYEVINPLPISFDEGIADIKVFTKDTDTGVYGKFLEDVQPDVIHVHTLMGLHKSFLQEAKARKIKTVFTTHDFFPICPKVTMFRHGKICSSVQNCKECGVCNATALGIDKIKILQSPIYRKLKDSVVVKKLRKQHRDSYLSESKSDASRKSVGSGLDYIRLRDYYYSLLKLIDMIHYNSTVTKKVYKSVFELQNNCIVNITHSDIKDNRVKKSFIDGQLRIRYLGPMGSAKGFLLLQEALDELWSKRQDFCLDVHFTPIQMKPYINVHDRYTYSDLKAIFDNTDVLVAPSIWYETFGFTVLEALSYGVPVIISGTVGARDILSKEAGIIVENITAKKLYEVLDNLTVEKLEAMNRSIVEKQSIMQIEKMSHQIMQVCYRGKCK